MIRRIPSILAAALLAAPLAASAADKAPPPAKGGVEQVYLKKCKNCHGVDGKAETKMGKKHEIDSFADAAWQSRHSDDEIREAINNGIADTKMKAYKDKLTPEQIDALVGYVRGFGSGGAPAAQPAKAEKKTPAPK